MHSPGTDPCHGGQAIDSDDDGTADCVDACPRDPAKTRVGSCGCGHAETDGDADGTADCVDTCLDDPRKTVPGVCGCGSADPEDSRAGTLYCLKAKLLHRYSFDGSGTVATDSVGTAHGNIVGGMSAVLDAGELRLSGEIGGGTQTEGYVSLASAAWPGLDSATFESWVTWRGRGPVGDTRWQRIFDFGDRTSIRHSYLYLTPESENGVRAVFSFDEDSPTAEVSITSSSPLPQNILKHVAVVADGGSSTLALYVDGTIVGSARLPNTLTSIRASNLWLGRSNFLGDPAFFGSLHEFRIYAAALTTEQLKASFAAGPDYAFRP